MLFSVSADDLSTDLCAELSTASLFSTYWNRIVLRQRALCISSLCNPQSWTASMLPLRVAVRTLVTDPRARLLLDGHITRRLAVALTPFAFVRSPVLQLVVVCSLARRSPYLQAITTRHSPDHCPPIRMAAVCQSKQSVLPSRQPQTPPTHRQTGALEAANQATMST